MPRPTYRPSDTKHYSRRFLSRPSHTDGTVEVAHLWQDRVMAEVTLKPGESALTIGSSGNNTIVLADEALPTAMGPTHPLVTSSAVGPMLNLNPQMKGDVYVETTRFSIAEAVVAHGLSIPITAATRARIYLGESTIFVHQGTQPTLALPVGTTGLRALFGPIGFSLGMHIVIMALIFLAIPISQSLDVDRFELDEDLLAMQQFSVEELPLELPQLQVSPSDEPSTRAEGEDEGRAGLEEPVEEPGRMAIDGPEETERVALGETQARQEAVERGVITVLREFQGPQSVFDMQPLGYDDVMAFGAQDGPAVGPAQGSLGLSVAGPGRFDGRPRSEGIGIGVRTRGRYSPDALPVPDVGPMREPVAQEVVTWGEPTLSVPMDRSIIQRVIRQHRREIRACYQHELQRDVDLSGRVVVSFIIDPAGNVASARIHESDLGDDDVEACLVRRIRQWRFPMPSNPGNVRVNYPFVFTSGFSE